MPIYVVNSRLVRAKNQAQAVRHVAKDTIKVRLASTEDVAAMIGEHPVEDASAEPEKAPDLLDGGEK